MTQSDSIPPEGEPDPTTEAANSDAANSDATSVGRVQPADQADQTQLTQFITTIKKR